jgi:predicted metal-dependent hydrolase
VFDYQLKKSKRRKTVAIKVHDQSVTVYAPHNVAQKQIDSWLLEKQPWIEAQLKSSLMQSILSSIPLYIIKLRYFLTGLN